MEAPKPQASLDRCHAPFSWMTAVAITNVIFNVLMIVGFLHWHNTIISSYGSNMSAVAELQMVYAQIAIPFTIGIAGSVLLLLKKWQIGASIALAGMIMYLVMDAIYISTWWDGHHILYSKTHATWLVSLYSPYWQLSDMTVAYYGFYLPALFGMALPLLVGWKKLHGQSRPDG